MGTPASFRTAFAAIVLSLACAGCAPTEKLTVSVVHQPTVGAYPKSGICVAPLRMECRQSISEPLTVGSILNGIAKSALGITKDSAEISRMMSDEVHKALSQSTRGLRPFDSVERLHPGFLSRLNGKGENGGGSDKLSGDTSLIILTGAIQEYAYDETSEKSWDNQAGKDVETIQQSARVNVRFEGRLLPSGASIFSFALEGAAFHTSQADMNATSSVNGLFDDARAIVCAKIAKALSPWKDDFSTKLYTGDKDTPELGTGVESAKLGDWQSAYEKFAAAADQYAQKEKEGWSTSQAFFNLSVAAYVLGRFEEAEAAYARFKQHPREWSSGMQGDQEDRLAAVAGLPVVPAR